MAKANHGAEVSALEAKVGRAFPEPYRTFVITYGGEAIGAEENPVAAFFGIGTKASDLGKEIAMYRDRIPADTLPIARDWGGNLFLLGLHGEHFGQIFRWRHEEEADEGETPSYRNVSLVADDFDQFVESLDEGPDWEPPAASLQSESEED
jgi:hypothetical protein